MSVPRKTTAAGRLARLGFADPRQAERLLGGDLALDPDGAGAEIVEALAAAADPDLALAALARMPREGDMMAALRDDPGLRFRLSAVLGSSAALGDHLARHPDHWRVLRAPDGLTPPARGELRADLLAAVGARPGEPAAAALRVAYRRRLLQLAARDLAGEASLDEVAAELADLAAAALEAALFPVDPNLRPEGGNGALVRTLASHVAYYQRWAKTWEFQALLKARPVAGDTELGRAYIDALAPMVWQASQRDNFVADVQAMRRRVIGALPAAEAGRQLKLGPGGLRDIEFAVQLLQLVHGRTDESLRVGATLPALAALAAGGYVGREDAASLAAAYRFLRNVEHLLQLRQLRRTHTLPADPAALRRLGRALNLTERGRAAGA